jgi:hypothetical protein
VALETDEELMAIHVDTLFNRDADGRIRSLRRPSERSGNPPRFFMGRTSNGNRWLFRYDTSTDLADELEELCRSEPTVKGLVPPPLGALRIRAALQARSRIVREYRGPAYVLPKTAQTLRGAVLITRENSGLLESGFPWMIPLVAAHADIGPVTATIANGRAASICYCARLSSVAAEAGVETLEMARGKGHATAAVSEWAKALRQRGLLPLYSTSWENIASRRVAEKLGAVCYGEDWEIE